MYLVEHDAVVITWTFNRVLLLWFYSEVVSLC